MKYVMVVPDGAADYPIDILGGKTPLEVADTPFMDSLTKKGILGRVKSSNSTNRRRLQKNIR